MYFATHFYFSSYHVFANLPLRYVRSAYEAGPKRTLLEVSLVLAMSYATAFMETLTISHFPYYDFEDRDLAYTVGSAFYGIYFIVSFPVYFFLDEERTPAKATSTIQALVDAAASSLASGMLVLLLLDLTRLSVVGVPLHVGGKLVEATGY
jgi:cycloeucalenol cycloisomerase